MKSLTLLSALLSSAAAAPHLRARDTSSRIVYQFAEGTWVENLAVRQNGNLLLDLVDRPEVYQIDPNANGSSPSLVYRFSDVTSVFGISEVSTDVFNVITGNFSLSTFASTEGSYSVYQIDLSGSNTGIRKVAAIPEAEFLNGMTTLNSNSVLVSDSQAGVVYRVDVETGKYEVVLDDSTMKPPSNASIPIGVNGIRVLNGYLYYQNLFAKLFCRVAIDSTTGKATGPYETLATNSYADDFAITNEAVAYAANGFENEILKVTTAGTVEVVAGSLTSTLVEGATSAQFGRTTKDSSVLYVTTGGGIAAPINGTYTEGGKIVALSGLI